MLLLDVSPAFKNKLGEQVSSDNIYSRWIIIIKSWLGGVPFIVGKQCCGHCLRGDRNKMPYHSTEAVVIIINKCLSVVGGVRVVNFNLQLLLFLRGHFKVVTDHWF